MIPLDQSKYDKVVKPLSEITINNLFARSVVEKHVAGIIYVDHVEGPKTFYVIHPYGMSLLFGETECDDFNNPTGKPPALPGDSERFDRVKQ